MEQDWDIGISAIHIFFFHEEMLRISSDISLTVLPPLACQGVFKVWNSGH